MEGPFESSWNSCYYYIVLWNNRRLFEGRGRRRWCLNGEFVQANSSHPRAPIAKPSATIITPPLNERRTGSFSRRRVVSAQILNKLMKHQIWRLRIPNPLPPPTYRAVCGETRVSVPSEHLLSQNLLITVRKRNWVCSFSKWFATTATTTTAEGWNWSNVLGLYNFPVCGFIKLNSFKEHVPLSFQFQSVWAPVTSKKLYSSDTIETQHIREVPHAVCWRNHFAGKLNKSNIDKNLFQSALRHISLQLFHFVANFSCNIDSRQWCSSALARRRLRVENSITGVLY